MELNPQELNFRPWLVTGTSMDEQGIDLAVCADGDDAGAFLVPFRCSTHMAAVAILEGIAGAGDPTPIIKFDLRPTAGSDTSRGDGDIGTINLGVTGASAQGDYVYDRAAFGTELTPGNEVVVELASTTYGLAGAAGHIWPALLVRYVPEARANLSAMQETT